MMPLFYFRWSQQLSGDTGFLGGSFRGAGTRGAGSGSNQRHGPLPPGLLAKGFPPPQPHPLFPLPPTVSLGGLMSPRNSLPGLPSLGVPGLLSPQQFLAKRPSLQETPSEVGIWGCYSNLFSEDANPPQRIQENVDYNVYSHCIIIELHSIEMYNTTIQRFNSVCSCFKSYTSCILLLLITTLRL